MKKICIVLSLLLAICCFAGCEDTRAIPQGTTMPAYVPAVDLSAPFIGFRLQKPTDPDLDGYDRVELEAINAHVPEYSGYGVSVYYDTLTPEEQTVYRIVQYAMDHSKPCIFIDGRLLPDMESKMEEILFCFALDNPLLEQNMDWQYWGVSYVIPNLNPNSNVQGERLEGVVVQMDEFIAGKLRKKKQAIEAAEKILAEMPALESDRAKAEYFYRYLGNNVEYYIPEYTWIASDHLYDTLCGGKSLCDGFSNAYSLLCNMAGIPCAEKLYTPGWDAKERQGHTWNVVQLDGVWYNVDATCSSEVTGEHPMLSYFGFSDELLYYTVDYEERAPKCEADLIPPDVTVTKTSQAGKQVKAAYKTVKKTDRKYVVVRFPEGEPKKSVMQKIANSLRKDIVWYTNITRNGEAVCYIFPE